MLPKSFAIDFLFIIGGILKVQSNVVGENSACDSRWWKSEIQFGIQFRMTSGTVSVARPNVLVKYVASTYLFLATYSVCLRGDAATFSGEVE